MKIGIDSYCYHRYFGEVYPFQKDPARRWTATEFVARAAELKVDGVSLETCFLSCFDRGFMRSLKDQLDRHHLDRVLAWGHPDGLEGGRNHAALQDLIRHIEVAKNMDADVMRIVGSSLRFRNESAAPQIERLAPMLREAVQFAAKQGVVLAIENHIDFTARELLSLIDKVGSPFLGVNFDTGNALRLFEDPVEEARLLAPHVHATHVKDVSPRRGGSPREWNFWESVPCGQGVVDITGVMGVLKRQRYEGTLCVEVDCLRDDWEEDSAVETSVDYLRQQNAVLDAQPLV
jgi:sugar phosphate isomerase/epimerase